MYEQEKNKFNAYDFEVTTREFLNDEKIFSNAIAMWQYITIQYNIVVVSYLSKNCLDEV